MCSGGLFRLRLNWGSRSSGFRSRRWCGWRFRIGVLREEILEELAFKRRICSAGTSRVMVCTFSLADLFLEVFQFECAIFDGIVDSGFAIFIILIGLFRVRRFIGGVGSIIGCMGLIGGMVSTEVFLKAEVSTSRTDQVTDEEGLPFDVEPVAIEIFEDLMEVRTES